MSVLKASVSNLTPRTVAITVWPTQPGFVFCKVDVQMNGGSLGILTGVSHYVAKAIQISMVAGSSFTIHYLMDDKRLSSFTSSSFDTSQTMPSHGVMEDSHDRYGMVHVTMDQDVGICQQEWFNASGWEVAYVDTRRGLFETVCDVWLTSEFSGMKLLRVNKNRMASRALLTNDVTSLDLVYERTRPFVELYDVTEEEEILKEKRVVLASFSRTVSALQVMKIACEGCIVLDMQRLNPHVFQFAVVANRPYTSVVQVSVMEDAVEDVSGIGNVRSTPLTLALYSGPFAVTLTSPQLPVTNNSTVTCLLFATEPLQHFSDALLTVKNGFIVSLDPTPHVDVHADAASTYHYNLVVRSTVQGSMCIEVVKGMCASLD